MTKNELLSIINKIDDKYINELADYQLRKKQADEIITSWEDEEALKPRFIKLEDPSEKPGKPFKKIMLAVGAVACVAAVGIFIRMKSNTLPVSPNDSADVSSEVIISGGNSEEHIEISDKFVLDMKIPDNIPSEAPAIKLALKTWDKEEIKQLFLSGKEIASEEESDEKFYSGEKFYYWETTDGITVSLGPGKFSYNDRSELDGKYNYGIYKFTKNDCNLIDDCYATNGELAAFSSADADKRAREMINKLGITNLGKPRVICVRADFANKVLSYKKDVLDKQGEQFEATPWTENEEIYILRYPQVFENTELSMAGINYPYSDVNGGFAIKDPGFIAVVSKEKIISLTTLAVFSEDYEVVENIPVNCNAEKAVDKLKEYLSNLVPMATTKYYKCQPVYIAYCGNSDNKTVNFKPAWEFAGYWSDELDNDLSELRDYLYRSQKYEYIWADTGHRYIEN